MLAFHWYREAVAVCVYVPFANLACLVSSPREELAQGLRLGIHRDVVDDDSVMVGILPGE